MKILYVASECAPYVASGGLGDVLGALPKFVKKKEKDYEVDVILPLYAALDEKYRNRLIHVCDISFLLSWRCVGASIFKISDENVNYYFIENEYYFKRGRLYGEFDDAERFAFFSLAVIEFVKKQSVPPDIIHANDWQAALVPIYLKTVFSFDDRLSSIKTLYTIHNIEYQGKFAPEILGDVLGIDEAYRGVLEFDGCINLMKGALIAADYINTVSPNYANELRYDFFSFGLSNIICSVSHKMCGVINGIDYDKFSPERDEDIYYSYSKETLDEGKRKNKYALQKEIGLENSDDALIIMVTRLTEGKGIDLVLHILDELLSEKIQFVLLGSGEKKYEIAFKAAESKYKNFKALIKFDRALSKKMYAAADMFLMPSKSEPCGLAQMIATSYGTVPIVRSVGGLFDTIISYTDKGANGFRFDKYNAHELLYTVKDALEIYQNKEKWNTLRLSAKESDFSWNKSAKKYIAIYKNIIKKEAK